MNPITHLLASWPVANCRMNLGVRDQAWIVGAGLVPDIDGLGLVVELATRHSQHPLLWWSQYHHTLAHNLAFGLLFSVAALIVTRNLAVAGLTVAAFHLHLLGDLVGARGPDGAQWPIPYFFPFSRSPELTVPWQWALNAWPNILITLVLLGFALWFAWRTGRSPLQLISSGTNRVFAAALRSRFPRGVKLQERDADES